MARLGRRDASDTPPAAEEDSADPGGTARDVGQRAVASLRRNLSARLADMIRADPDWAEQAADVGLVDRAWLEDPADKPFRTAAPTELMQRFLERSSEQRPSVLTSIGLSAVQALSLAGTDVAGETTSTDLTVVFTDLEDFTRFTTETGDEAAAALLAAHSRSVGPVVRSRGGRIVKHLGDGFLLTFPAPEAAVLATLELLETGPDQLRVRAGLHTGETAVMGRDVVGQVVNVAARIVEQARGGRALASTAVRDAVVPMPGVRFGRARKVRLKGVGATSICTVDKG